MGVKVLFVYWNQNWKLTNQCMQFIFFCLVASISYKSFWNKLLFIADKITASWKTMKCISKIYQVPKLKNNHRLWNAEVQTSHFPYPATPPPPPLRPVSHGILTWALFWLLHFFKLCCSSHPFRTPTSRFCSSPPSTPILVGLVVQTLNWIVLPTG